ncbi:adenosylmethionine--8-amino-7-oxononanoate transaminase [Frankia sp. AgB1.9]|uniref:adenosylmethionine--8-amino-7-oxononanoate transaminase n=1 Tax=unclassified Frankia TaxID=2632575 RepID=UPI00193246B2|nr:MULTISPECIES: adenosylmethionine--8-amino-7-oxononanoate transaminase [unclassified Frankia]MBL7489580.1 adenosylmethionine--8-amino-7-oxononanoate transaminase [Frankia sp. AgW1.1]MBL7552186.1 adenosylmethionine--8-amino-7-oxononanoate transaminase [Frankia sp. AgB1.9]MBL7624487.1 adenosylmethionine--8-amino-7-oxononanoate transaminase [Frankia sp. AgB1.8]
MSDPDRGGPDPRGSAAARLVARDRAVVWHPYAAAGAAAGGPLFAVASASGVRLQLTDGRELIDGMSSWWAAIHGYRHPVLDAAAHAQLDAMAHVMFGGLTHEPAVRLAETLVAITPPGLAKVFLCDSGSVSVEVAIKMALQYWLGRGRPRRTRLLTVRRGYHGDTSGAMAVCDPDGGMHHLFTGLLSRHLFAPAPPCGFDEPCTDAHVAPFAALLAAHADEVAAVILEPVLQGTGAMRGYHPGFLTRVRELCDEHGVLLIADEIATGFGRTGELFGCDHAGISPDIMCVGKALTGGYLTMAATLCTDEVADGVCASEAGAFMHGPTFMANPLAAAVATANLDLLLGSPWRENVRRIEAELAAGLAPAAELPGVAEVRTLGAVGVIETREPVDMTVIQPRLVELGVWVRPFGRLVYTMPPYITDTADIATLTAAMVEAVATASR